jgi:hypothetical protein
MTSTSPDSESPVTSTLASSESLSFSPVRRGTAREGLRGQSSGTGHFTSGCDVANLSIWVIRPWRVEFGFSPQLFLKYFFHIVILSERVGLYHFSRENVRSHLKTPDQINHIFRNCQWAHYFSRQYGYHKWIWFLQNPSLCKVTLKIVSKKLHFQVSNSQIIQYEDH